jgi:uncharacterized membrane protein
MTNAGEQKISPSARPVVLSLLCMVTFVSGFFRSVLFLWAVICSNNGSSGKNVNELLHIFLGINSTFSYFAWIAVTFIAMAGAGLMWKLKKSGFYMYTSAAIIAYLLPAMSSGADMLTIQRLFFTSVFIFCYGIHLKFMN